MIQSNDAQQTPEMMKHLVTSMMFYGGLAVYMLIILAAILASIFQAI